MPKRLTASMVLSCAFLCAWLPAAAENRVVLDPVSCELSFTLQATLHKVRGELDLTRGELEYDPDTGAISGELVLDATATETGNRKRDRKMHEQVLKSGTYPEIVFRPLRFEGDLLDPGRSEIRVTGTFSILGTDHEITVPVAVEIDGDRLTAAAEFTVPYVEWGMTDPSVFVLRVAKEVRVLVRIQGRLERES